MSTLRKRTRTSWPPEEDEELKLLLASFPPNVVAEKLGRTYQSVMARSAVLGLNKASQKNSGITSSTGGQILQPKLGVTVHLGNYGRKWK